MRGLRGAAMKAARSRQAQPAHPPRERIVPQMLLRRKVVSIVRFEDSGWNRTPELDTPTEVRLITAVLSDGTRVAKEATVTYKPRERERILEAMTTPGVDAARADWALRAIVAAKLRRARAAQTAYGELQRAYSR